MASWSQFTSEEWLPEGVPDWLPGAVAAGVAAGTMAYLAFQWTRRPRNLPPGPPSLPLLGAIPFLSKDFHLDLLKFKDKYKSDVVSFHMGSSLVVALNSERVIKKAFVESEDFSDHPRGAFENLMPSFNDLIFYVPYSKEWRERKKFMMQTLRNFGFGTVKGEERIVRQVNALEAVLDSHGTEPWTSDQFKNLLTKATAAIIAEILIGKQYEYNDSELNELINLTKRFQTNIAEDGARIALLGNIFPIWLIKMIFWKKINQGYDSMHAIQDFIARFLVEHRETATSEPRDFMDALLAEYKDQPEITDAQIIDTTMLLLPDAVETLACQIQWCLFYICRYPQVQRRMVEEIRTECGARMPNLQDKTTLPFCECVILETMRISTVFTISAFHAASRDSTLDGYNIPAGTTLIANLYAAHYDDETFTLPEEFSPERFLQESGSIVKAGNVIPFGVGRRICLGETLTRSELFLFLTHLVFKYHISFSGEAPASKMSQGIFRSVPPHNIQFVKRL